ncbi:MAG: CHASE2 domain-containing protein, partial [Acetobacteraceae bacterium]
MACYIADMRFVRGRDRRLLPELSGLAALALLLGLWCLSPALVRDSIRERTFDALLPLLPERGGAQPGVVIVDIDRAALARFGPWPWPRAQLARIVAAAAAARPAALGVDILLASPDRFSAEGDALLAQALTGAPTALGFALELGAAGRDLPTAPILAATPARLPGIWRADGVIGPTPVLAAAAQGFGAMVLAADPDGPIRRVPLLAMAGGTLRPGLAVEVLRLAQGAGALLIDRQGWLHVGNVSVPLGTDAALRLVPSAPAASATHTVAATTLLDDPDAGAALTGRVVLIGGSAPELGGLRVTPASAASPSVRI